MIIETEIVPQHFPEQNQKIKIKIYDSCQECFEAHLGCKISEVGEMGGFDGQGKEYKFTPAQAMENMIERGYWGFCDDKTDIPVLHIWYSPDCEIDDLIHLLAHERGHSLRPYYRSEKKEEMKADQYGETARFAYQVALQMLELVRQA